MHEAFAAFCFLWLVLGATVIKGIKLVENIGVDYVMIMDLKSLVVLKCFSMECEEFLICLSTRHLEISRHNKGFMLSVDRYEEESPFTLGILVVYGQTVVAAGLHVLTGVVTVAGWDLLVYRLTFGGCL